MTQFKLIEWLMNELFPRLNPKSPSGLALALCDLHFISHLKQALRSNHHGASDAVKAEEKEQKLRIPSWWNEFLENSRKFLNFISFF